MIKHLTKRPCYVASVTYELFRRPNAAGELVYYVRFFSEGQVVATRSTKATTAKAASEAVSNLLRELDFSALAKAKQKRAEGERADDDRFRDMSIADFVRWYWSDEGYYVVDRKAAETSLSSSYLYDNRRNLEHYIAPWPRFQAPLREADFALVDRFFREIRKSRRRSGSMQPISRYMLDSMLKTIRSPLGWAAARGLCQSIDFSELVLPARHERERDFLTDPEIAKVLALPAQELWRTTAGTWRADLRPRPRLKGAGAKNEDQDRIDIRMKAFVLMGPFLGFRRGEERGLRWKSVRLEEGFIRVENNYVRGDGDKAPKADSFGDIPLSPELEVVLWELKEFAKAIKLDSPDDYVLFNPKDPTRPMAEKACYDGWRRTLRLIGISDAERERRHLVPHGSRHRFATKLIEAGIAPEVAQKFTRHKTLAMLEHYADHLSAETMAQAMEAVRGRKQ